MQTAEQPPATIEKLTLDAPVSAVTLLEDRALVRREGKVSLNPGLWRIRVEKVAPVLADKSLRAEFLREAPDSRIDDVRVRRRMLIEDEERPQEVRALLAEWKLLRESFTNTSEDREHLQKSFYELDHILVKTILEIPIDAVWGQLDAKMWREQFKTLFGQKRSLRGEILSSYNEQKRLSEEIQDLAAKIQALSRPDLLYTAYIEADLTIATAGEYDIAFDYVVPNGFWRPWHQARLLPGERPRVSFRCDGCVWQRTGEDWNDVDLVFSTARASLGTEPPLLADDYLSVREKAKEIAVQLRDRQVQTTGAGAGATTPDAVRLPGVDDGGETRNLRPAAKATIPSDGRPYRVPIFEFESPAEVEYILMPEISERVVLKSVQTNNSLYPILAGPVDLVRSQEFVGKTSVMFIAPGEKFALGWGPDAALRVQRTVERETEVNPETKWRTVTTEVKLFISNIGPDLREIKTTERVPISELELVKIEVVADKTTEGILPDENGFCRWNFTLLPYSQITTKLTYKLSAAPEVKGI